ncbi:hypothetical protein cyc_06427 [Cyclospora cayetanensis]|uniref:Uncharacterized protein n=1 Tax=Cyclospora cayetanensis TaxID=88456 RepID=A0A1D3CUE6_9EIME|nr:hypothetical protein cyc_06427 [Cyclospora cayetanensis]
MRITSKNLVSDSAKKQQSEQMQEGLGLIPAAEVRDSRSTVVLMKISACVPPHTTACPVTRKALIRCAVERTRDGCLTAALSSVAPLKPWKAISAALMRLLCSPSIPLPSKPSPFFECFGPLYALVALHFVADSPNTRRRFAGRLFGSA